MDIEGAKFRSYLMPINQRGGIQTLDELGDRLRFETVQGFRRLDRATARFAGA